MPNPPAFERLLQRDRRITLAGLLFLSALAWLYIVTGAGMGMTAWEMTALTLFPYQQAGGMMPSMPGMDMTMAPVAWAPATWALVIAMWWIMMVAMMTPSAAPAILLYARVHRHAVAQGQIQNAIAPTGVFALGYLTMWFGFSVAAAILHWLTEQAGILSVMTMGSQSRWLSASVLIAAGLYQFTPFKAACLSQCRAPAQFLSRHWRPGASGAMRLGLIHGAYCVGCCWMLMALLFVGGIMNLVWIAGLAGVVLIEKLSPPGRGIGQALGGVLILWGVATLFV